MTEAQEWGATLLTSLMAALNINSPFQESTLSVFLFFNVLTEPGSNLLFSENLMKSLQAPPREEVHFGLWFHLLLEPHLLLLPSLLNLLWRSFAACLHPPWRSALFGQSCLDLLESLSNDGLVFCQRENRLMKPGAQLKRWVGIL